MKAGLKTYSHLYGNNVFPDDYRVVTEGILYAKGPDFAIKHPVVDWYHQYQSLSDILCDDAFDDPARLTYMSYVTMQNEEIIHLEHLEPLCAEEFTLAQNADLPINKLAKALAPLKYIFHTIQLTSSYLGKMAPAGKIVTMHLFQAADAMKGVELIERLQLLFSTKAVEEAYHSWINNEALAAWRKRSEELLATYPWTESFIALQFSYRPLVQNYIKATVIPLAEHLRCGSTARALLSLLSDMERHQRGADALRDYIWDKKPLLKLEWTKLIAAKQADVDMILPIVSKNIEE